MSRKDVKWYTSKAESSVNPIEKVRFYAAAHSAAGKSRYAGHRIDTHFARWAAIYWANYVLRQQHNPTAAELSEVQQVLGQIKEQGAEA